MRSGILNNSDADLSDSLHSMYGCYTAVRCPAPGPRDMRLLCNSCCQLSVYTGRWCSNIGLGRLQHGGLCHHKHKYQVYWSDKYFHISRCQFQYSHRHPTSGPHFPRQPGLWGWGRVWPAAEAPVAWGGVWPTLRDGLSLVMVLYQSPTTEG